MNFLNILNQLAEVDSNVFDRFDSRRAVFSSLGTVAKRSALAAAPVLITSMFQKAYAGTNAGDPIEVLNYALTLEYLEADFYNKMKASPFFATASSADQAAINQISKHETAHVALLRTVISGVGGASAVGAPVSFKTSTFATLTSFQAQLAIAQQLEDIGVRAYKGRATDLQGLPDVNVPNVGTINALESALRIHSVEARHAAHIRVMRGQTPWINGNGDLDSQPAYTGTTPENNVTQAGYNLTSAGVITPGVTYSAADVQAAFDEILTKAEVLDNSRAGSLVQ
ncbi:ferritin-like domain-containing protein [Hymenobacter setariae]|uniref:Ferritin-like domain-containing protein n=1 Tax=Hymenobacter setariae TaxID=2594794 RepID=A0A558BVJ5_9BACT|nr:ferritin-like domain-containing protein [Hymenobacter setariae]TVT40483.1 ferritin-like domain-containing protein [Hymenobacter setariae]